MWANESCVWVDYMRSIAIVLKKQYTETFCVMIMSHMLQRSSAKRIIKDIMDMRNNPLTDQGIHYTHDDEDMTQGFAMIVGPTGTPYAHGYFLFDIKFPTDYPTSPPQIKFMTQDSTTTKTRFNPNLYRNGKVCVSMLNTWHGEQWSGCQTLSSVLLTLCTLFTKNPLLNEPGVKPTHHDVIPYRNIIAYKTIDVAIHGMVSGVNIPNNKFRNAFHTEMVRLYNENTVNIMDRINSIENDVGENNKNQICGFYGMVCFYDFQKLREFQLTGSNVINEK